MRLTHQNRFDKAPDDHRQGWSRSAQERSASALALPSATCRRVSNRSRLMRTRMAGGWVGENLSATRDAYR